MTENETIALRLGNFIVFFSPEYFRVENRGRERQDAQGEHQHVLLGGLSGHHHRVVPRDEHRDLLRGVGRGCGGRWEWGDVCGRGYGKRVKQDLP